MKNMKKLAGLMLALIMALALTVPAFAAGTGTITVENATIGETYSIYKIFDATYSGENASYTIKSDDAWYNLVKEEGSPFTLTQIGTTDQYNVAVKEGGDVIGWLNNIETLPAVTNSKKAEAVEVEFTGVAYGYYLIKSTLNGGGTLTVDNVNPDATVIDKNQEPGNLVKEAINGVITDTEGDKEYKNAEIGEEIEFKITYTATNYDGDKKIVEYFVDDDMPEGFDLVANTIAVKVGDKTLTLNEDYTITYGTEDPDDFKVTIPWVTGTAEKEADKTSLYDSPTTITVTYKAVMNADAVIDGAGNTNTATITHRNADKDNPENPDPTKDTDTETVYTYALAIMKVSTDGKPLAGAKFTLKQGSNDVKVSGENGVYTVDATGSAEIISPESGLIVIKGLEHADYTLTEIEAPEGYNLLPGSVTVTPERTGKTSTTVTKWIDKDGNVVDTETDVKVEVSDNVPTTVEVVVNFTGSLLPDTGGIGTTIFYTVGGILVVGAAILLVTRKRMKSEM